MNIIHDANLTVHDFNGRPGVYRIRIWQQSHPPVEEAVYVVVMSETPDNPGMSITNAVELVATRVWTLLGCPPIENVTFFEHYPQIFTPIRRGKPMEAAETFDRVGFDVQNRALLRPLWFYGQKALVEQRIGGKLDEETKEAMLPEV